MARRTRDTVRQSIFDSYFSDSNRQALLRQDEEQAELRAQEAAAIQRKEEERRKAPPNFDNVETGSSSYTEPTNDFSSLIRSVTQPAVDYTSDLLSMSKADIKSGLGARMFTQDDAGNSVGAEFGRSLYDSLNFQGGGPISSLLQSLSGNREDTGELGKRLYKESSAAKADIQKEYKDSGWLTQGGVDLFGSPLSALSVIGGPTALITGEDVFNKTYTESRLGGASKEASAQRAAGHMAAETAFSAIPAGKLLSKIPIVSKLLPREGVINLLGNVQKFALKTGLTATGEATEEVATTLTQLGLDKTLAAHSGDENLRKVAASNIPEDTAQFWNIIRRTAVAGVAGGVALGSPIEMMNMMKEAGTTAANLTAEMENAPRARMDTSVSNAITPTAPINSPTQPDMFGTPTGLPAFEEHAAGRQKDLEIQEGLRQGRAANSRADALAENSELRRVNLEAAVDTNRQRVEFLQEKVSVGNTDQQTLSSLAAAIRDTKRSENLLANHSSIAPVGPTADVTESVADTKPAVQADLFTNQESAQLEAQRTEAVVRRTEASKVIAKEGTNSQTKAKQNRAIARRTFMSEQLVATKSLDADSRITAIADASAEWDMSNPLENFVPATTLASSEKVTSNLLTSKPVKKAATPKEVKTVEDQLNGFLTGLSQQSDSASTGTVVKDVTTALVKTLGKGDTKKLAKLIIDRNLQVVESSSDIPAGAVPAGAHGFYDGNKMYVVADRLDPKNIVGGMLDVVAHEVKHAADISGKVTLGEFVGARANAALNAKIEAAASRGDKGAMRALELAKAGSKNPTEYALELPAYYINVARNERSASRTPILRDMLSAVRVTASRVLPGVEVTLNDVAYLSDKLITEAAVSDQQLSGQVSNDGNAMIYDKTATGFDQAFKEGRTYESADGINKFVLSDADSTLEPEATKRLFSRKSRAPVVKDVLKHDVLFEQMPEAKDIPIYVVSNEEMGDAFGKYMPADMVDSGYIMVREDVAKQQGDVDLRQALMHEVQHWVQDRSARRNNFFDKDKLPKPPGHAEDMKNYNQGRRAYDKANRKLLDSAKVIKTLVLPGAVRNVDSVLYDKNMKDHEKVSEIMDYLRDADALEEPGIANIADAVNSTRIAYRELGDKVKENNDDYFKNLTESEAFYTQDSMDITQDKLPVNPEADMRSETGDYSLRDQEGNSLPMEQETAGLAFMGLGKKVTSNPADQEQSQIVRNAKRLLLPGGGFGPFLEEALGHERGLSSDLTTKATDLGNQMLRHMKNHAAKSKKSEKVVREEISKQIEKIDELPTREQRDSALDALNRTYEGVGSAVRAIRDFKLQLTRDIITIRLRDIDPETGKTRPLTEKEQGVFKKMQDNAERYTTRAYLATYNTPLGKTYGKNLLAKYKTDPNSEEGQKVVVALQYLVDNELTIPDAAGLGELKYSRLRRMHENWIGDASKFKGAVGRKSMIKALMSLPPKTKEEIDKAAFEVARDMLGQKSGRNRVTRSLMQGAKQNRTILEGRTDIPVELRRLLGEITDPFLREAISLQRMIQLASKTKLLTEIAEGGKKEGLYAEEESAKFNNKLNSPAYGPMDGKWISNDLLDALASKVTSLANLDAAIIDSVNNPSGLIQTIIGHTVAASSRISSIQKTYRIVYSMAQMGFNFAGAFSNVALNGITNSTTMIRALKDTTTVLSLDVKGVGKFLTPAQIATSRELTRAGVIDSATVGDLKSLGHELIVSEIAKLDPNEKGLIGKLPGRVAKNLLLAKGWVPNAFRQVYAFMDVWVKVATYYDRKDFLTKFNEFEGKGWTNEQIERKAGYEASGTNISYERAIPLVKILERTLPVAMFLTYFSEVPRSIGMSYLQAASDLAMGSKATDPRARNLAWAQATKRITGTTAATLGIIAYTLHALESEDEDEERKRALMPDYIRNQILIPMGLDKDKKIIYGTLNKFDPNGPLNDIIIGIAKAPEDKKFQAALNGILGLFVPAKGSIAVFKVISDMVVAGVADMTGKQGVMEWDMKTKRSTVLEKNYPKAYAGIKSMLSAGDVGANLVEAIEHLYLPAGAQPFIDQTGKTVTDMPGDSEAWKTLRAMGYRPYVSDPAKELKFSMYAHGDDVADLRNTKKEMMKDLIYLDAGDVASKFNTMITGEREAFEKLQVKYDSFLAYDRDNTDSTKGKMRPSDAIDVVDDKKLFAQLRTGKFESKLVDVAALDGWRKAKLEEPEAGRQQINEEYKLLKRTFFGG